jgi:hypothetical protein
MSTAFMLLLPAAAALHAETAKTPELKQEKDSAKKSGVVLAFVALNKLELPTSGALEKALREYFPEPAKIADIDISDKVVFFSVNGQKAFFGMMPTPIPWGDLEGPCAVSWLWKDATEKMKAHKAHLIVTLLSDQGTRVERELILTRLVAAGTKLFDSVGVYWGDGTNVLPTKMAQEFAVDASLDKLPILEWIEFRIQKNDDKTVNVLTTGLDAFGYMEIEVINSKRKPSEVLDTVMGTADLILQGEVFKDGETLGPDADTKYKIHHTKSTWDRPGKVIRIEM